MEILSIFLNPLTFVVNLFLGLLVLLRNPKRSVNRVFAAMAIFIGFWGLALLFYGYPIVFSSLTWIKIVYLLALICVYNIFYLSYIFPDGKRTPPKILLLAYFLTAAFFFYIIVFTDLQILRVIKTEKGWQTIVGSLYPLYSLTLFSFCSLGYFNYAKKAFKSEGLVRAQTLYLLAGLLIFTSLVVIFDGFLPLITGASDFFIISSSFSIVFVALTAYAIIKHRLWDIRLVVARSVSYSLLLLILGGFYAVGFFFATALLTGHPTTLINLTVSTFLALTIAFSFQFLRRFLERFTNRIFFKEHYEPDNLLHELSLVMASFISLETLTQKILEILCREMGIAKAAFLFPQKKDHDGIEVASGKEPFLLSEKILEKLKRKEDILVFDELEEVGIKEIFRKKRISVFLTLKTRARVIGFLVLGEKVSGDIYFAQDIKTLEILAPQFAIVLQNTQRFEEIKQFNITLKAEVKKATEELRQAYEDLKELDKMKDEFLDVASHELRTPLTAIRGNIALLEEHFSEKVEDEELKEIISDVKESSVRLVGIVNDFLDVSRLAGKRIEFKKEPFDLVKLVQEVIDELKVSASEKALYLRLEKIQGHLPNVLADTERTRQVVTNLLGNAVKFTKKGGVVVKIEKADEIIKVKVSDTGIGILKEKQKLLFQKFQQAGENVLTRDVTSGTGLGLFISRQLVEGMGGKIYLESSELGEGSTFAFELPIAEDKRAEKS